MYNYDKLYDINGYKQMIAFSCIKHLNMAAVRTKLSLYNEQQCPRDCALLMGVSTIFEDISVEDPRGKYAVIVPESIYTVLNNLLDCWIWHKDFQKIAKVLFPYMDNDKYEISFNDNNIQYIYNIYESSINAVYQSLDNLQTAGYDINFINSRTIYYYEISNIPDNLEQVTFIKGTCNEDKNIRCVDDPYVTGTFKLFRRQLRNEESGEVREMAVIERPIRTINNEQITVQQYMKNKAELCEEDKQLPAILGLRAKTIQVMIDIENKKKKITTGT